MSVACCKRCARAIVAAAGIVALVSACAAHVTPSPPAPPAHIGQAVVVGIDGTAIRATVTGLNSFVTEQHSPSGPLGAHWVTGVQVQLTNLGRRSYATRGIVDAALIDTNGHSVPSASYYVDTDTGGSSAECWDNLNIELAPGEGRATCIPFDDPSNSFPQTFQLKFDRSTSSNLAKWQLR